MKILFFDGYCSLCNELVDWAMARDTRKHIQFASLQGQTAKRVLPNFNSDDPDTVVYWSDNKDHHRSSAILLLLGDIGWPWKALKLFFIIPRPMRDLIYSWVAKNRYRFFKKRDTCRVPSNSEKERLLP